MVAIHNLEFSYIFTTFVKNSNLRLILLGHAKFGIMQDRMIRGRVICICLIFNMAAVRHLGFGVTS